uniref:Uncharacterized protein n=1 Tax=Anopheles arabiensis TaxID=7173 RepID=A0A182IGH2_ANOAR
MRKSSTRMFCSFLNTLPVSSIFSTRSCVVGSLTVITLSSNGTLTPPSKFTLFTHFCAYCVHLDCIGATTIIR